MEATIFPSMIESKITLEILDLNAKLLHLYSQELFTEYLELEPLMNKIKENIDKITSIEISKITKLRNSSEIYQLYIDCNSLLYYLINCLLKQSGIVVSNTKSLVTYIILLQKEKNFDIEFINFIHALRVILKSKVGRIPNQTEKINSSLHEQNQLKSENNLEENEENLHEYDDFILENEMIDMIKISIYLRNIIEHIGVLFKLKQNYSETITEKDYRCNICRKIFKDIKSRNDHLLIESHHQIVEKCCETLTYQLKMIDSFINNVEILKTIDGLVDLNERLREKIEKFILSEYKVKSKSRFGVWTVSYNIRSILETIIGHLCYQYKIFDEKERLIDYLKELKTIVTPSHINSFCVLNDIVNKKIHTNVNNYNDICIDNDIIHVEKMMCYLILVLYDTISLCQ